MQRVDQKPTNRADRHSNSDRPNRHIKKSAKSRHINRRRPQPKPQRITQITDPPQSRKPRQQVSDQQAKITIGHFFHSVMKIGQIICDGSQ